MPTSPSEDEPDDRFLRDPEDLTGFLQDIDPKAGDRLLPFEPEDDESGARTPFWGAGAASEPSRAGSAGQPQPSQAGRTSQPQPSHSERASQPLPSEAGDDRVWEAMGVGDATDAGGDRSAGGDRPPEVGTDRDAEVAEEGAEEAPDEAEWDPARFWGTGFVPAAGEDELTAGLARLERLMWDGGDF